MPVLLIFMCALIFYKPILLQFVMFMVGLFWVFAYADAWEDEGAWKATQKLLIYPILLIISILFLGIVVYFYYISGPASIFGTGIGKNKIVDTILTLVGACCFIYAIYDIIKYLTFKDITLKIKAVTSSVWFSFWLYWVCLPIIASWILSYFI